MAATQLSLDTAASGHILRDYYTSGGTQRLIHLASCHNTMFVMNHSTGTLVIQRDGQELFRADIMDITSLVAATPALRFIELANLMVT
jgi:hypothetical protein